MKMMVAIALLPVRILSPEFRRVPRLACCQSSELFFATSTLPLTFSIIAISRARSECSLLAKGSVSSKINIDKKMRFVIIAAPRFLFIYIKSLFDSMPNFFINAGSELVCQFTKIIESDLLAVAANKNTGRIEACQRFG